MEKVKTLWSKLNYKALIAMAAVGGIVIAGAVALSAWGPARTTYTLDQINNGALGNKAVLNSIKDEANVDKIIAEYNKNHASKITTWIGDETQFLNVKEKGTTTNDEYNGWRSAEPNYTDPQVVQEGKTYRVRMFVHNNNPKGMEVLANNVVAKVNMADESAQLEKTITAYIQGSNTNQVYDEAKFVSGNGKKFNLAYVPGSVEYVNNWTNNSTNFGKYTKGKSGNGYAKLTDNMFAAPGAQIGYSNYNANTLQFTDSIPGCYQYSGWIFFDVIPQFQEVVAIGINKEVSQHGKDDWKESISVKPGDVVDYRITYANKGTTDQINVTIRDILPEGMSYVKGTTQVANAKTNGQFVDWTGGDTITENGINASINDAGFAPVSGEGKRSYVVMFSAKVNADVKLDCGKLNTLTNIARVSVTAEGDRYYNEDPAKVTIQGPECKSQDKDPVFTCKVLEADKKSIKPGETVKFTVTPKFTDGLKDGETVKVTPISYSFNYGDGQKLDATDKNVIDHKYDKVGTHVATAKVQFKVSDKNSEYIGSADCQVSINVTSEVTPPPVAPEEPEVIAETGTGLAIGSILGGGVLAYGLASVATSRKRNNL
ncbi:isopeptide-forming domain-containing fimbrial protein [Candidatus Saccharibacteria bacterium]|nr:isopeptide-forming domain-containing fimbrial protein [Candidatus Saccharibacteria bacterium]